MKLTILIILIVYLNTALTQQEFYDETVREDSSEINLLKLSLVSGLTVSAFVYGHALQQNIWWKGEKSSFHFEWDYDWRYALGSDKFGHFYFPYVTAKIYSQVFEWTGIEERKSLYYASTLALSYQAFVEVKDGFSKQWGFSWGDFAANALGSLYPVLQYHYPMLNNYSPKISFYASERFKKDSHKVIIDDYESTYNWVSINVHNLLPDNLKKFSHPFVNIAVGHSVKNLDSKTGGNHELFVSLDWNLEALPGDFWLFKLLKKNLNYYHLPAPAIKIYPNVVWYGLKF